MLISPGRAGPGSKSMPTPPFLASSTVPNDLGMVCASGRMTGGNGLSLGAVGRLFGLRLLFTMVVTMAAHPPAASAAVSRMPLSGAMSATGTVTMAEHVEADHAEAQQQPDPIIGYPFHFAVSNPKVSCCGERQSDRHGRRKNCRAARK